MAVFQSLGVHHITIMGVDRQTSIDFWEGVMGMPFIFEQPNLDNPGEGHLYFDPGDGRMITIFTDEARQPVHAATPTDPGCVHHLAFRVDRATYLGMPARLKAAGIAHSGFKDRHFMDSIYFRDPLGLLIELACNKFDTPQGVRDAEVLMEAHILRTERGHAAIEDDDLADAVERLTRRTQRSLSDLT